MARNEKHYPSPAQLAELSALADGTLDAAAREGAEARIAASPELRTLYERERRVVELLQDARAAGRAPSHLRARIDAARPGRVSHTWRRGRYGAAVAGALAAAGVAVGLVLPGGAPGAPSVSQAAALALRAPTHAPPAPDPTAPGTKLTQDMQGVYFPDWSRTFGWQAIGFRSDRLDGRSAATVYYARRGRRIAYTIVAAPALRQPAAQSTTVNGVQLRTLVIGGRTVVTWRRAGHTCVLSGARLPARDLRALAAWREGGLTASVPERSS